MDSTGFSINAISGVSPSPDATEIKIFKALAELTACFQEGADFKSYLRQLRKYAMLKSGIAIPDLSSCSCCLLDSCDSLSPGSASAARVTIYRPPSVSTSVPPHCHSALTPNVVLDGSQSPVPNVRSPTADVPLASPPAAAAPPSPGLLPRDDARPPVALGHFWRQFVL